MLKQFIFGCALASGVYLPSSASAQNFCPPTWYYPCCSDALVLSGFYIGANAGVISHLAFRNDLDAFLTSLPSSFSTTDTDFTGGFQMGVDWQCRKILFGVVLDWNWSTEEHRFLAPNDPAINGFLENEIGWFSSIRGRAGIVLCDVLFYTTLGGVVARFDTIWNSNLNGDFEDVDIHWGWIGGAGVETRIWRQWSLGFEILSLHFKQRRENFDSLILSGASFTFGHSDSMWIGRVLLNYRFGDGWTR